MFFVLVSFMISTVMAARSHLDLQMSRYDGLELERDLAARGASARALVELNKDDEWKEHDRNDRVLFQSTSDGSKFNVEGWAQQDPDNPIIYHVYGRAFTSDSQSSISSRVTLRRPDTEGVTFASAPVVSQYTPDSLFYKKGYDTEWTQLPPVPRSTFNDSMQLVDHGGFSGSLNNLAADDQGRLYAHYIPGYDDDGVVGPIFRRKYGDFLKSGDFAGMYRAMPDYVELLGYGLRKQAFGNSVLWRFDTGTESWSALPAVPDVGYSGGQAYINQNRIYDGGVGSIEVADNALYTTLYRDGHDAMMKLDFSSNEWEVIQPPGGLPEAGQVSSDGDGNIYAKWHTVDRNRSTIFRRAPGRNSWEAIPSPPKGQFDENNEWQPMQGEIPVQEHMEVTPDGKVFAVWNAHQENSSLEYVMYEFSEDENGRETWKPIPPSPRFYYRDGELVREQGASQLVKGIAVDSEGRIIQSIDEDHGNDPLAYKQGDDYIPFDELPYQRHDRSGQYQEDPDRSLEPFQAAGGGFRNGAEDRYIPVYRY